MQSSYSLYINFIISFFSPPIWAGHVARIGERRGMYRVLWGNLRERDQWGDPGIDGRII
jgi:hypothetical protein